MEGGFDIDGVGYRYLHHSHPWRRKYGLAVSYWKTNILDLLDFLARVKRWTGRELIAVSVCSAMALDEALREQLSGLADYVVACDTDRGHQDGTTLHCNGALYPLLNDYRILTATHTDADTPILSPAYFFGHSQLLLDSNRVLLTSTVSRDFNHTELELMPHHLLDDTITAAQFGSTFILSTHRLPKGAWPFQPRGNFESDRHRQFIECGLTLEDDAIILPRVELMPPTGEHFCLRNLDFSLGVMHNTNAVGQGEKEDRKVRMRRVLGIPREQP